MILGRWLRETIKSGRLYVSSGAIEYASSRSWAILDRFEELPVLKAEKNY